MNQVQNNPVNIFSNISSSDPFELETDQGVDYEKLVKIFDFDKNAVSKIANVSKSSVRYDDRMPAQVRDRLDQIRNILNLVAEHFMDSQKTILWFETPNPFFGNISPRDMIRFGRYKKLIQFIIDAREAQGKGV